MEFFAVMNCHSWKESRWWIETHCWLFFIYLCLFAPYLSKPLTGVQTPGSTFPQQLIMLLFSLLLMGKAFCAALRLIWSSFPLPFNFPNYLGVLYPIQATQFLDQVFRNETWTSSGTKKRILLPLPRHEFFADESICKWENVCLLLFLAESTANLLQGATWGHFLINPFCKCWHCITWLG